MIDLYPNFLPQWTQAILSTNKQGKHNGPALLREIRDEFGLNYYSTECCLTGEAFFNTDAPVDTCTACHELTYDGAWTAVRGGETVLYLYKMALAEHLKTDHPEIWKKRS